MRKVIVSFAVLTAAAFSVGPAAAAHGEPHYGCLGQEHARIAASGTGAVGALVSVAARAFQPFGTTFVKARATECEGL